jgi:hypothetical protein
MKKIVLFLCLSLFLFYCKTKKKTESAKPAAAKLSVLEIAQKRWNGSTQTDLDEGKNIFTGKCTKCHGEKKIVTRSEKSWLHEIDDMSPRAGLTDAEKLKLTKYILSYREANTTTD